MSAVGFAVPSGACCDACPSSEQDCARNYPCCADCTHDFGEHIETRTCTGCHQPFEYNPNAANAKRCPECRAPKPDLPHLASRCTNPYAGTDTGYYYHLRKYGTPPCDACKAAHTAAARKRDNRAPRPIGAAMTTPAAPPTHSELLARARQIDTKAVQRILDKIDTAFTELRTVLADEESKAAARRDVQRLERALAEAKAKLRGGSRPVATIGAASHPCRVAGCTRTFDNGQGRALHERRAHGTGTAA